MNKMLDVSAAPHREAAQDMPTMQRREAAAAAAPGRPRLPGRRRARRLSGRRLSGAARGRHRARLDHRHLDRRHQRQPDRRQRARESPRPGWRNSGGGWRTRSSGACRTGRGSVRRDVLLVDAARAAFPASSSPIRWRSRGALSARTRTAPASTRPRRCEKTLDRAGRLLARQALHAAADGRRRARAHQPDALLRQSRDRDHGAATSWRRARCRRPFRPFASTASSIGTAAFSPTRRPRRSSTTIRAATR